MDTSLDVDSLNLLQEMEEVSNALKKHQLQHVSNSETVTDINQLINNEHNIFSDDDISNMPVLNFQNNSVQQDRLNSISNALQNNKNSRLQSTDIDADDFVSANEFATASENSEVELDEDKFTQQRHMSTSTDLRKQHLKMRINSMNSDIVNKRLFSINSDILNHVTISDQKGNNSRQMSQDISHRDENTFILDEQSQDVTKMLQRIDNGLENNNILMESDQSRDVSSHGNTLDSEGDFNSSFSLKIANKESDDVNTSDNASLQSVKYSNFVNEINLNSDLRMSSVDDKRSISSSSNKFQVNRIISPSQIVQISPELASFSSFDASFGAFDFSMEKAPRQSEYSEVMNRIVSPGIDYPKNSANTSQLDQSRNVLRNLRRRVTSDILKVEIAEAEDVSEKTSNNISNNRISSSHSLLSEMNKLWESAINLSTRESQNDGKALKESNNDSNVSQLWNNDKAVLGDLDMEDYKQSELVTKTLKNSDDHVVQRTSSGLGIYHNMELVESTSTTQQNAFDNNTILSNEEPGKQIIIGNVQDLLLVNGISLNDNDQQNINFFTEDETVPQTPKKNENTFVKNMKVSSPVKVVNRAASAVKPPVIEAKEPVIEEIKELDGRKKHLKLKDNELSNLGYMYISLSTLSLTNFIKKSNPNVTFADKKAEIQVLFDNGEKIIESEWVPLTNINSGLLAEDIDISSQEYMTEIPIKPTLDGFDDTVLTLQFTFKMRYEHIKSKFIEVQDRIPIIQQSNKDDENRTNSFTKSFFHRRGKQNSSISSASSIFGKGRKVEYQTVVRKVEQKVQDPWTTNFSPDGETFGLMTAQISLADISSMTNVLSSKRYDVMSTSSFNNTDIMKSIGCLNIKVLHLSHVSKVIPKSISAISAIIERKQRVLGIKFDSQGIMYQQGLDVPESCGVRRRRFVLENGLLNGYSIDDSSELKVSINLENVRDVILDCETCPAPGYNFEMIFDDKSRVVLSCDTINQRRLWLGKIKDVLDVLRVVSELDIEIK